jgi:thioredoxin-dependent peroxiredoxin
LIEVGARAPSFQLPDSSGKIVNSDDFIGKNNLVVYFYVKDFTSGCTRETCSFRDAYQDFKNLGAEVIGISSDSETSHDAFAKKHQVPFILLSDQKGSARKAFGVKRTLGIMPGRVTFLIDKKGVVRDVFSSATNMDAHVEEALRVLKTLE